jgi:hypothetical protein
MDTRDMSEQNEVLRSIEKLQAKAGQVHRNLLELHESARFDHRLPGLADRAAGIETDTRSLSDEAERLRERLQKRRGNE